MRGTRTHDSSALRAMGRARPSGAVQRRIVQGALSRLERRRRRRRGWSVALVAAAAAAALLLALQLRIPQVAPERAPLAGTVWRTGEQEPRRIALGRHRLELSGNSQVRLAATGEVTTVVVERGSTTFVVARLRPGQRFGVDTPHARVEVKGTVFSVNVQQRCTEVAVTTGAVAVAARSGATRARLGPGQTRVLCDSPPPPPVVPMHTQRPTAEQELRRALQLLVEGRDHAQAARLLAAYLEQHPRGVFAEDALFHLIFVEQHLGRIGRARDLARQFVNRFPKSARARRVRLWLNKKTNGRTSSLIHPLVLLHLLICKSGTYKPVAEEMS